LSAKEWSPADHGKGELWILEAISEVRGSISLGITYNMPACCRGCVHEPIQICVPITSCILLILDTEISIGNCLLKLFLDWVSVPDDKIEARYGVYEANTEVQIQTKIWDEWVSVKVRLLADSHQERAMINHMKTLQDDEDKFVHNVAERKEIDEASKARTAQVKPLEREKKCNKAQLET
jgi:hypothetical protein